MQSHVPTTRMSHKTETSMKERDAHESSDSGARPKSPLEAVQSHVPTTTMSHKTETSMKEERNVHGALKWRMIGDKRGEHYFTYFEGEKGDEHKVRCSFYTDRTTCVKRVYYVDKRAGHERVYCVERQKRRGDTLKFYIGERGSESLALYEAYNKHEQLVYKVRYEGAKGEERVCTTNGFKKDKELNKAIYNNPEYKDSDSSSDSDNSVSSDCIYDSDPECQNELERRCLVYKRFAKSRKKEIKEFKESNDLRERIIKLKNEEISKLEAANMDYLIESKQIMKTAKEFKEAKDAKEAAFVAEVNYVKAQVNTAKAEKNHLEVCLEGEKTKNKALADEVKALEKKLADKTFLSDAIKSPEQKLEDADEGNAALAMASKLKEVTSEGYTPELQKPGDNKVLVFENVGGVDTLRNVKVWPRACRKNNSNYDEYVFDDWSGHERLVGCIKRDGTIETYSGTRGLEKIMHSHKDGYTTMYVDTPRGSEPLCCLRDDGWGGEVPEDMLAIKRRKTTH